MKQIISRHGIPELITSDNGSQLISDEFDNFLKEYDIKHVTSSPKFPQSNGMVERGVQTIKNIFKKASDPYLALLIYRSTPLQNGFSPSELSMGRKLRTNLPILSDSLMPVWPPRNTVLKKEAPYKLKYQENFNKRHNIKSTKNLLPGTEVWITNLKRIGTIICNAGTPRSYVIKDSNGRYIR